jgi:hypothetical protein
MGKLAFQGPRNRCILGYSEFQKSRGEGGDMEYCFAFTTYLESYLRSE